MPTADWATSNSPYGIPQPLDQIRGMSIAASNAASSSAPSWNDVWEGFGTWINKASGVEASNAAAAKNASDQRQWEEDMDNTKYQRAVQDMKKAGINPATLSGMSSSSVGSAPSGAAASTHGPTGNIIGSLISLVALLALRGSNASSTKGQTLMKSRDVWPNQKLWRKG